MDLASFRPRRILVCQLRQLGDVILTTPSLELLHKWRPEAELHLLTEQKCVPLLDHNPHVDKIWELDKRRLTPVYRELAWYRNVARQGYDLIVDFQQLPRCRWVVAFSRAPVRLSYTPPWYTRFLYTHHAVPLPGYAAKCKASVLSPLGITWQGEKPRLYLTETERQNASDLLAGLGLKADGRFITLDPTHRQPTRRWPLKHYSELVRQLRRQEPEIRFLPLWGPGEEEQIKQLVSLTGPEHFLLPQHMLSLREMAACINAAVLHIGNCSAPRHMAVAVNTPSLTLRGSTSDAWTYPSAEHQSLAAGLACQPCNRNTCPHCRCLEEVRPETATAKALEMLRRRSGSR